MARATVQPYVAHIIYLIHFVMRHLTRFLRLTALATLMVASLPTWAYDFALDGIRYTTTSDNTVSVIYGGDYTGDIVIPQRITEDENIFYVTAIADRAFHNCNGLTAVTLPTTVESIGSDCFSSCTNLQSINLENVKQIGESAFYYCKHLTDVTLSNELTEIGRTAFYESGITSITIPAKVEHIGGSAFKYSRQLKTAVFQNSPIEIPECLFESCTALEEVAIPSSVTHINARAFCETNLTSIEIPASVTKLESCAFSACRSLKTVMLNEGLRTIGDQCFNGCSSLSEITLPESLDSIETWGFLNCNITEVTMPTNIKYIGGEVFGGTLTSLYIQDLAKWIAADRYTAVLATNADSKIYLNNRPISNLTIPEGTKEIGAYAFANASCIRKIKFPSSGLTRINAGAFYKCTSITSVDIPEGVDSIYYETFSGCTKLAEITFPQSLKYIQGELWNYYQYFLCRDGAFRDCGELTELVFPDNLEYIGGQAFYNATKLASITLNKSLKTIGGAAFSYCDITSIEFPESIENFEHQSSSWNWDDPVAWCYSLDTIINRAKNVDLVPGNENVKYIYSNALNASEYGEFPNAHIFTFGPDVQTIPSNFVGSSKMLELHSESTIPPYVSEGAFSYIDKNTCILYVPKGCVEDYRAEYEWEEFKYIVEEGKAPEIELPFEVTTVTDNFGDDLHCYTMKIRGDKYLHLDADGETVLCTAVSDVDINDEKYLWCFAGNTTEGISIYNISAGPNKILWTSTDVDGNSVIIKSKAEATGATTWSLLENGEGYTLKLSDSTFGYPNDHGGNGILKIWASEESAKDAGSRIIFTPVSTPTGIIEVSSNSTYVPNIIHDLSGRIITNPSKGVYISNGKKIVIN